MQRAFRYRFYPTPDQESLLRRTLGCVRLVYNRALDARSTAWATESKSISYLQGRLKVCPPSRPGACQHRFRSVDLTAGDARHPFRCSRSAGSG